MQLSTSTHLAASTCSPCTGHGIPPELVSRILTKLWEAPQTPQERSALLKNTALVNRTWLTLVACITSRDVHISNKLNANAFLRLLPKSSPRQEANDLFTKEGNRVVNEVCRSITFHVDGSTSPGALYKETPPVPGLWSFPASDVSNAMSLVLGVVSVLDHLPNLRHISLRYTDWGYDDVFKQLERFPQQVTHLSLDYAFTARPVKSEMWERWIRICTRHPGPAGTRASPSLPNLRHLSLSGATTISCVVAILHISPNIETFETTDPRRLPTLLPFVPAVRTLVLHLPGVALSRKQMMLWPFSRALDRAGFPKKTKLRIVVRSGTPDPVAFMELRRGCKRFNAELVYERG